jgi:hypothetical protein
MTLLIIRDEVTIEMVPPRTTLNMEEGSVSTCG